MGGQRQDHLRWWKATKESSSREVVLSLPLRFPDASCFHHGQPEDATFNVTSDLAATVCGCDTRDLQCNFPQLASGTLDLCTLQPLKEKAQG